MFHQMGVVSTKTATRLIYLDAILYLSAGIIGTATIGTSQARER